MAYVKYENLKTPNEVLEKMCEYVKTRGYTVIEDIKDDLNVWDMSSTDGKKFVFMDKSNTYYVHVRSANGTNIFGDDDASMDSKFISGGADCDPAYYGIGMTVSEGYSKTQRWYNQYLAPNKFKGTEIQAVWIPINDRSSITDTELMYTLYCNEVTTPTDTLVFSVVAQNTKSNAFIGYDRRAVHLVFGCLYKYDNWTGGAFFSGSSTPSLMKEAAKYYELPLKTATDEDIEKAHFTYKSDGILPVLSSGSISNTFLRIDIDDAPKESRGYVYWASSGTDNVTGKPLSVSIRVNKGGNGAVPHYGYMQSSSPTDWGHNINTLNCITLNMPIYFSVRVDPDALNNYAGAGQVTGVYYVSMLNMQTGYTYEMSYPKSNDLCQVFSESCRRDKYGFDGISIRQSEDDSDSMTGDITTDTTSLAK